MPRAWLGMASTSAHHRASSKREPLSECAGRGSRPSDAARSPEHDAAKTHLRLQRIIAPPHTTVGRQRDNTVRRSQTVRRPNGAVRRALLDARLRRDRRGGPGVPSLAIAAGSLLKARPARVCRTRVSKRCGRWHPAPTGPHPTVQIELGALADLATMIAAMPIAASSRKGSSWI